MIDQKKTRRPRRMARELEAEAASQQGPDASKEAEEPSQATSSPPTSKPQTKAGMLIGLLQRTDGATLDDLTAATGWLPHTTRAALTGLRKKGHALTSEKVDGVRRYRIAAGVEDAAQ